SALADCHVAGIRNGVLCGTLLRPLDPARPQGASIPIRYVVVPAMARRKFPDPVFLLAGGPGQSAIAVAASTMALFSRLNNRRDIVFVDQRGTGGSAARPASARDHPDRQRRFAALLQSLPRTVKAAHPLSGRAEEFVLTRDMLLGAVRSALYAPALAAALPEAIDTASRGEFAGL